MKVEIYLNHNRLVLDRIVLNSLINREKLDIFNNSELVYSKEIPTYPGVYMDDFVCDVFRMFNINHPVDYIHRSVSVGDTIALTDGEKKRVFFVDGYGYTDLTNFLSVMTEPKKYETTVELNEEDSSKSTVEHMQYVLDAEVNYTSSLTEGDTVKSINFFYDESTATNVESFIVDKHTFWFISQERKRLKTKLSLNTPYGIMGK